MSKLICAMLFGLCLFYTQLEQLDGLGDLLLFINIPALLFIGIVPLLITSRYHSIKSVRAALKAALGDESLDPFTSQQHQSVLSTLRTITSTCGIMIPLMIITYIFTGKDIDPKFHHTVYFAVSFVYVLYALIMSEVLIAPLLNRLHQRTVHSDMSAPANMIRLVPMLYTSIVIILFFVTLIIFYKGEHFDYSVLKLINMIKPYL